MNQKRSAAPTVPWPAAATLSLALTACSLAAASDQTFIRCHNGQSQDLAATSQFIQNFHTLKTSFLKDTDELPGCNYADISFAIADIKYDGDRLKILELGEGTRSTFAGFDQLYGSGAMWHRIWNFLSTQTDALFFLDRKMTSPAARAAVGYTTLVKRGGQGATTAAQLLTRAVDIKKGNPAARQLAVIRHELADDATCTSQFNQNFTICNAGITKVVNNKKLTDALFAGPLRAYRPYTTVLRKRDAVQAIAHILNDCPADAFVIKPLTACQGQGIIFTARDLLQKNIATLFGPHSRGPHSFSPEQRYWLTTDTQDEVIIEACESSKPVIVDGHAYDATLRVVCGLACSAGTITVQHLGAYWKLPQAPIDSTANLQDKKLSHISRNHVSSAPLSPTDEAMLLPVLLPLMAQLYANMLIPQGKIS
jgi:hypothetical protein